MYQEKVNNLEHLITKIKRNKQCNNLERVITNIKGKGNNEYIKVITNILDKHGIECVRILGKSIGTTIIPTLRMRLVTNKYISFQNIVLSKPKKFMSHKI